MSTDHNFWWTSCVSPPIKLRTVSVSLWTSSNTELELVLLLGLRSYGKVEVVVLGSPSVIIRTVEPLRMSVGGTIALFCSKLSGTVAFRISQPKTKHYGFCGGFLNCDLIAGPWLLGSTFKFIHIMVYSVRGTSLHTREYLSCLLLCRFCTPEKG